MLDQYNKNNNNNNDNDSNIVQLLLVLIGSISIALYLAENEFIMLMANHIYIFFVIFLIYCYLIGTFDNFKNNLLIKINTIKRKFGNLNLLEKDFQKTSCNFNYLMSFRKYLNNEDVIKIINKNRLLIKILNEMSKLDSKNYYKNQKIIDLVNDFDKDCIMLKNFLDKIFILKNLNNKNRENFNKFMDKELNNDFLFLYKKVINLKNNLTSEEFFLNIESDKYIKELEKIIIQYDKNVDFEYNQNLINNKMDKYSKVYKLNKEIVDENFKNINQNTLL